MHVERIERLVALRERLRVADHAVEVSHLHPWQRQQAVLHLEVDLRPGKPAVEEGVSLKIVLRLDYIQG